MRSKRGRPPNGARSGVSHLQRLRVPRGCPLHVTVRLKKGLPSLRRRRTYAVLRDAFAAGCERFGMRMSHYSVMSNHIHMIVEAADRDAVSRGMKGLLVRIARALNRLWGRAGSVFADRYHDRVLRTARQVRKALAYVLNNGRRHGIRYKGIDHYASGWWFDGWFEAFSTSGLDGVMKPVADPRGKLLREDWRWHGLIFVDEVPGRFAPP